MMRSKIMVACLVLAGPWAGRAEASDFTCWLPSSPPAEGTTTFASKIDRRSRDTPGYGPLIPVTAAQLKESPYKYIGKLEFRQKGESYVGTAEFIGKNTLITAAHNIIDQDGPATTMTFYRVSTAEEPHTFRFDVEAGAYLTAWGSDLKGAPDRYDYAVLRTKQDFSESGLALKDSDVFPGSKSFDIVSYSDVSSTDDREQMFHKPMTLTGDANDTYASTPTDTGSGRSFTTGASGGAWLLNTSQLFSVEASGKAQYERGPVLTGKIQSMIQYMSDQCK